MTWAREGFIALDHVQVAMPAGGEARARAFYVGVLGMSELAKPAPLAARGGAWFAGGDGASVQIHCGVEPDFRPARKAHPAVLVVGIDDAGASASRAAGHAVDLGRRARGPAPLLHAPTPSATASSSSKASPTGREPHLIPLECFRKSGNRFSEEKHEKAKS